MTSYTEPGCHATVSSDRHPGSLLGSLSSTLHAATKPHLHHWHLGNQACMRHAACMVTGQVAQRLMPWESSPPGACGVATAGACLHRMLRMQAPVQHYGHNTQQEWHAWRSSTRRTAVPDRHRHRHLLQEAQALAPSTQVSPVSVQSERPRRRGGAPGQAAVLIHGQRGLLQHVLLHADLHQDQRGVRARRHGVAPQRAPRRRCDLPPQRRGFRASEPEKASASYLLAEVQSVL